MLSLVTAAEQQYRHESSVREREHAMLVAIRDRRAGLALIDQPVTVVAARPQRTPWARPIGLRLTADDPCPTACAIA
ncbi:hypothetical protein ASD56_01385 [Microbacterium sp. Root166]|jgi:hypothetical protein|uniref:hypothetical protein n=1 Tax=Microbacterium sp. Root166 TaxID=1736478 RepID=UPI000701603D|nr:hypothetical protein [Microbacterium sp. Root166]KQZ85053.1 hypothetical protein ASD56_01385 [Microbacterium sp. Root166]